jgi:hypothetical protein
LSELLSDPLVSSHTQGDVDSNVKAEGDLGDEGSKTRDKQDN